MDDHAHIGGQGRQAEILLVEDEEKLARFLQLELEHEGYRVTVATTGSQALDLALNQAYGIILLDVMLPGISGVEICVRLRARHVNTPIIMLTARDAVDDRVTGLDAGANDYLTKPFAIEELLARIRVQLRTSAHTLTASPQTTDVMRCHDLIISPKRRQAWRNGRELHLTRREFDLLEYLVRHQGLVCTRDQIIQNVWGFDFTGETNVVDVYIRYLRSKVDEPFHEPLILTVRGVGYTMRSNAESDPSKGADS